MCSWSDYWQGRGHKRARTVEQTPSITVTDLVEQAQEAGGLVHESGWIGAEQGMIPYRLTTTPCNYGGVRYWFVCEACQGRARTLYMFASQGQPFLACRKCLKLSYRSCQTVPPWLVHESVQRFISRATKRIGKLKEQDARRRTRYRN